MSFVYNPLSKGEHSDKMVEPQSAKPNKQNSTEHLAEATARDQSIPIAIVGMSFQFPDNATSTESFWSMLLDRRCASRDFPLARLKASTLYHPDPSRGDTLPLRGGHFIERDLESFDAPFFSISAAEAVAMDPMSRALLETTYRALENAGIPMENISNSNTSVYTGNFSDDYESCGLLDLEQRSKYGLLGLPSLLSGRLSWFFNLLGPCLTLDTACSSSLVALDLGCQSLYTGASDMSIVTGTSLIFSPNLFHLLSNMGMLSPDSKSFSFDHRANGYGRGEGIAALILKRLPDALRDGDTIRSVIRSTGTNHDGHTPGVTYPSKTSQLLLIQDTYRKSGLSMLPTRYFEAHGTGTPVGDPIEADAIGAAFRNYRTSDDPLYVGSVKSNIGHLEGCSGLAAVIKTILILENGIIPPNANFEKLNPRIDATGLKIKIPVTATVWPAKGLRRISINSFGASGTNAHVIVDDAYHYLLDRGLVGNHRTVSEPLLPKQLTLSANFQSGNSHTGNSMSNGMESRILDTRSKTPRLMLLSAMDKAALQRTIDLYDAWLKRKTSTSDKFFDDLVYTLALRRSSLPVRSFAILDPIYPLRDFNSQFSASISAMKQPQVAFVFTGQGAQWNGMGKELLSFPVSYNSLLEASKYLNKIGCPWDLINQLCHTRDNPDIHRPSLSQILCTVIQVAICDLFYSFNFRPVAVVGHSSGEISAAYCTGAISRESAWKLAYFRGVVSEELTHHTTGGMMAVGMSAANIQPLLDNIKDQYSDQGLTIACINSPESLTISGDEAQLETLAEHLSSQNIFHRQLKVRVAYHSPKMKTATIPYKQLVRDLDPGVRLKKSPIMISSITGEMIDATTLCQVDYWVQNMLQPVRFSDAVARLCCSPASARRKMLDRSHLNHPVIHMIVEIGPHSALKGPIRDTLKTHQSANQIAYYSALMRNEPADKTVLAVVGHAFCHGFKLDLGHSDLLGQGLKNDKSLRKMPLLTDLPEYPFDHSRKYWPTSRLSTAFRFPINKKLDLLGKPALDWNPLQPKWRHFLKLSEIPWAADHQINGVVIYPAVGMLVMVIEAANQLESHDRPIKGFKVTDIHFSAALVIPGSAEGIETQLQFQQLRDETYRGSPSWEFRLYSCENDQWRENSHGKIQVEYERAHNKVAGTNETQKHLEYSQLAHRTAVENSKWSRTTDQFYTSAWSSGYNFGPSFRAMDNITFSETPVAEVTASVKCFEWQTVDGANHFEEHVIHPTTLDALMQTSLAVFSRAGKDIMPTAVPAEIESFWLASSGLSYPTTKSVISRARLISSGNVGYETSVTALESSLGRILMDAKGIKLRFVTETSKLDQNQNPHTCYNLEWKPDVDFLGGRALPPETTNDMNAINRPEILEFVMRYLDLAIFKRPNMAILHFGRVGDFTQKCLLEEFCRSDGDGNFVENRISTHGKYIWADLSQEPVDELQASFEIFKGLKVIPWDTKAMSNTEMPEEGTFDMVFASCNEVNMDFISNAHRVLKSGGKMVLLEISNVALQDDVTCVPRIISTNQLTELLQDNGFSNLERYLDQEHHGSRLIISTKTPPVLDSSKHLHYSLVIDSTSFYQQELGKCLQKCLEGVKTSTCDIDSLSQAEAISQSNELIYIFLPEMERPVLETISSETFLVLQRILVSAKGLLWLTSKDEKGLLPPSRSIIDGLGRVLRAENDCAVIVTASLERDKVEVQAQNILTLIKGTNFISTDNIYEPAYEQIDGRLHIGRLVGSSNFSREVYEKSLPYQSRIQAFGAGPPLTIAVGTPGLLDSLHFVEDVSPYTPLGPDEVEIKVLAVGLNFKDLLITLGRVNETRFGTDSAGVVNRAGEASGFQIGERVCILASTAYSTYVRAPAKAVARVPDNISLAHAASVPTQFGTAWYAIRLMAKLQKGETILIHSAAGGTGQAAIQIAQHIGGEVFATVGSEEKKKFIIEHCHVAEDHIFYSRDTSFAEGILRMTNNRGVDVVLNSLAGEMLIASWGLIAPYGRFIELGKKDIEINSNLPMRPFIRNATFSALETSFLSQDAMSKVREVIEALLGMFITGTLHPVEPFQILPISEVQKGMRMLQEGNMMGKTVFEITDVVEVPTTLKTKPSFFFDDKKTYVIAGGTGGLGRAIARWMVYERHAKNLLLLSRSGDAKEDVAHMLAELRKQGATVEAPVCDISNIDTLRSVLERYQTTMPKIAGCIQASMVLRDSLFANMPYDEWRAATDPKTLGSWNLHTLLPKGLDFFVFLSSVAGLLGSAGQANYAAGNTYMDSLARYRIAQGERAVSLDLGVMLEHGVLASNDTLRNRILAAGYLAEVSPPEFFALLDHYCDPSRKNLSQTDCQVAIGIASASTIRARSMASASPVLTLPMYQNIFNGSSDSSQAHINSQDQLGATAKYRQRFIAAKSSTDAGTVVSEALVERLLVNTIGILEGLDAHIDILSKPAHNYGVDSLSAIELRSWLAKEFDADVPIFEILGERTLASLGMFVALRSKLRQSIAA